MPLRSRGLSNKRVTRPAVMGDLSPHQYGKQTHNSLQGCAPYLGNQSRQHRRLLGEPVGAPANYFEEDRPRVECRLFFNKLHDNYIYIG